MLGLETSEETIPITWPVVAKSGLSNNTAAGVPRNEVHADRLEDRQRHHPAAWRDGAGARALLDERGFRAALRQHPPAEAEARYYPMLEEPAMAACSRRASNFS